MDVPAEVKPKSSGILHSRLNIIIRPLVLPQSQRNFIEETSAPLPPNSPSGRRRRRINIDVKPLVLPESQRKLLDNMISPLSPNPPSGRRRRLNINVQPLQLPLAVQPAKKRKIDVRQNLFKMPAPTNRTSSIQARHSTNRTSSIQVRHSVTTYKKTTVERRAPAQKRTILSPLLDIDEAEEYIFKKNQVKTPVKACLYPVIKAPSTDNAGSEIKAQPGIVTTPNSAESDREFLKFEEECTVPEKNIYKRTLAQMKNLISKQDTRFNVLQKQFDNYKEETKVTLEQLKQLIDNLECDKENRGSRNSERKPVNKNLRKDVLMKTIEKQVQSPRSRRADDLYKTLTSNYSVLSTPGLNCDTPAKVTRSLSQKLKQQCLMLQDTPRK